MKTLLSLVVFIFLCTPLAAIEPCDILDYWLGPLAERDSNPCAKASLWFQGGEKVDNQIKSRFGQDVHDARFGRYLSWRENPRDLLALVVLLDQFSRHVYRNSPEAFAADTLSLSLVLDGIACGDDLTLFPVERLFFYLPLQHAEDRCIQSLSVCKYQELVNQSPPVFRQMAEHSLEYAIKHQEIIERFGRFPHRNKVLGRQSTTEEEAFLLTNPGF